MKQRHVDCLKRLLELTASQQELIDFLKQEKLMTVDEEAEMKLEVDKVYYLCGLLFKYSKEEKLQLLSFEWVMLPKERVRLRMVTDRRTKEISYHY